MKKILSILCVVIICAFSSVVLSGCVEKTYKLVGMVDEANDLIVYYDDLPEERKAIIDSFEKFTIELRADGKHEVNVVTFSAPTLTEYTIKGKYDLEGEVLYLHYTFDDGTVNTDEHQYTNGRIIYHYQYHTTGHVYLVFE